MAMFVGLDVSLKTTLICVVEADGTAVWEGKAESEPASLIKTLTRWRDTIALVGIEACPLSEWLYGALVECGFRTVCIETRHAQRFLSSRPNKTDRSDARGIADMMRLGHYRPVHVKSKASQLPRTALIEYAWHLPAISHAGRHHEIEDAANFPNLARDLSRVFIPRSFATLTRGRDRGGT